MYAILGIHPHEAGPADGVDGLRELLAHERAVAVGETGLDFYRDYAPRDRQRALFERHLELARELGKPVVIHNRAADDEVLAQLASFDGDVVLHCFSYPGALAAALERGYYVSFAGNVTYKNASELRVAASQVPRDRLLAETDCPYSRPSRRRGRPNEPANVVHTARRARARARRGARRARGADRRERGARVRPAVNVAPKKELGQHFLVDENILGVIGRLAELGPTTSCSRSARGSASSRGTSPTAPPQVHAVELDRSLEPTLREALGERRNVAPRVRRRAPLRLRDARPAAAQARREPPVQRRDAARRREPRPPAHRRALDGDGAARGRRPLLRGPGTKAYGGVSVLLQLATERTGFHPVSRNVFRPRPNVDSALVAFRRTSMPDDFERITRSSAQRSRTAARRSRTRSSSPASPRASRPWQRSNGSDASRTSARRSLAPDEFVSLARCDQERPRRRSSTSRSWSARRATTASTR